MSQSYDVIIIGAGAAGVAAARRLAGTTLSVLVIEASARVGGRAYTAMLRGLPLDLGCGWLHSGERNAWREVAEQRGIAVDRTPSAWRDQFRGLGFPPEDEHDAGRSWQDWGTRLETGTYPTDRAADALEPGGRWNAYLQALSGYINGAALEELSIADYLAYDRAASDLNWRLPGGYGTLVAGSLPPVPLQLATPVTAIDHRGNRLRVETPAGSIEARAAIVTVSSNVLGAGQIRFFPALDSHLHAASCLPLGLANKVFLGIEGPSPFEPETHVVGNPHSAETGSYYIRPFGRPVIEVFYGGPGAARLEQAGLEAAFAFAGDELAELFGSAIRRALIPLAGSSWASTDYILGSYSHAKPGEAHRRGELAAPAGRLFFAGEATHPHDFSTAHGAHTSGLRAAEQALAALKTPDAPSFHRRATG